MGFGTDTRESESNSVLEELSRRTVLKITGAGAGIAALGGGSMVGAGQEGEDETEDGEETTEDDEAQSVEDSIDPVFGHPLAADETDDVDVENVVELYTEEGEGEHVNFPQSPAPENGGEASEFPFEFAFDPAGIQVTTDDVVQFQNLAGEHTVTAFQEKFSIPQREVPTRVPDGVPGFTSPPIVDGESWLFQFPKTGVYDIFCLPHMAFGMVMRVVVSDPDSDEAFEAPTAGELPPNPQMVLTAPELDPDNIVDQGSVAWADLTLEAPGTGTERAGDAAPTVHVGDHPEHGSILIGPDNMTLYMFDEDTQGEPQSACYEGCAENWPPLTTDGDPVAGEHVTAELSTFERETGETQVMAGGWPLYYFAQDQEPGDVNGQGVGDVWWVLRPDGTPVRS